MHVDENTDLNAENESVEPRRKRVRRTGKTITREELEWLPLDGIEYILYWHTSIVATP